MKKYLVRAGVAVGTLGLVVAGAAAFSAFEAHVVNVTATTEPEFQAALINGVVHYPGTALPGELGNVYIFGHSSDNAWSKGRYKNIFAVLPQIQKGAKVYLSNSQGQVFAYLVTESLVVGPQDVKWLDQEGYRQKLLTLQTSYPIGTSLKRFVVRAELSEK